MSAAEKTAAKFSDGDRVRIIEREPGNPDPKALTYYPFYRNLTGKVIKSYTDNTVAVDIDRGALPDDIRERHERSEAAMRDKWLGGLSEDDREKLSEKAKRFTLRYTLLVSANDLAVDDRKAPRAPRPQAPQAAPSELPRKTPADLFAAEEEHLREIERKKHANGS